MYRRLATAPLRFAPPTKTFLFYKSSSDALDRARIFRNRQNGKGKVYTFHYDVNHPKGNVIPSHQGESWPELQKQTGSSNSILSVGWLVLSIICSALVFLSYKALSNKEDNRLQRVEAEIAEQQGATPGRDLLIPSRSGHEL